MLTVLFRILRVTNRNLDLRSMTSFRDFTQFTQLNYPKTGPEHFISLPLEFILQNAPFDATQSAYQ